MDDLGHDLLKLTKIALVLIAVLVLVLLAGHSALEWYKWRCLKRHLERTRKAWMADPTVVHTGPASAPTMTLTDHNLLMLHADSTHPLLMRLAYKISALLRFSRSQHINLSWFFHYVFHPPALACFLIGFFGVLSVELQLLAIRPLEAKFHEQATVAASDLSGTIFTSLNRSMFNQSAFYANDINTHIDGIQSTINDGLLGWVNGTTTTLNNTINTFYSDLQDAVSTLFNGTVLEQPAQEFIKCFIGSKVDKIEEALTFIHNNLHIDISRVNDSVLVISPQEVNAATQPIANAAVGGNDSPDGGLVGRLINTYIESLKKERVMFAIFLAIWAVVVFMALVIIFWHSYGRRKLDSRRGQKSRSNQRTGLGGTVVSFREEKPTEMRNTSPKVLAPISIPRVEPSDPNRLHPLSAASKSFDSFFDHASPVAAQPLEETGSAFRRLSRKFLPEGGWRKHLTLALRSDKRAVRKSFRQAHRPKLTISTERAASMHSDFLPEIERISPSTINAEADSRYPSMRHNEPKSQWSPSPETATMPAPNPGARRKPSVPVSVGLEAESAMPSPAAVALANFSTPLPYGLTTLSAPGRMSYVFPPPPTGPARARTRGVDPFKTPFDDDARVVPMTAESMAASVSFLPLSAVSKDPEPAEVSFATGRAL